MDKVAALQRHQRDLALWKTWDGRGRRKPDMQQLLHAFTPMVNSAANRYIRNIKFPIHPDVIRSQFKIQAVKAFETYNPRRGVQLSTHVFNTMKKATRFLIRHRNIGVIPEVRALKIRDFQEGKSRLVEMLGREPTAPELSRHLRWSPKEIRRMESELRPHGPTTEWEDEPTVIRAARESEVIHLLPYELGHEQRLVHEFLFGLGGKPQLTPGEIARRLQWTPSKVTRLKNQIIGKINEYL